MHSKHFPFYIFTIALFIIIVSPNLFSDGMFMDGILYAVISKNLANNVGAFWNLHLTSTLFSNFHEHPPLSFGFQSLFFKVLGNGNYVERIYSLSTFIITCFLMVKVWYSIVDENLRKLSWLPLLFWVITPTVTWAASNNLLENTMMIFTTLSVLFIIKSLKQNQLLYLFLAGFSLFCAFLSKGFVGLYPLSLIFWIYIFNSNYNFKWFLKNTLILLFSTLFCFLILYVFYPESIGNLIVYFNKQIVGSISSVSTVDTRFFIIIRHFTELLPVIIITAILFLFAKKSNFIIQKNNWVFILLILGFCGVLPIMISMKQRGFYILTTYPIFSIAFALYVAPFMNLLISKINISNSKFIVFKNISLVFLVSASFFMIYNVKLFGRDKEKLADVYSLVNTIPNSSTISIEHSIADDWSLHGYMHRYGEISLSHKEPYNEYMLVRKGFKPDTNYIKKTIILNNYDLYFKED
jgi:4-amino-4-deoxy-L-arabinose transferase-like glycosyltransferase